MGLPEGFQGIGELLLGDEDFFSFVGGNDDFPFTRFDDCEVADDDACGKGELLAFEAGGDGTGIVVGITDAHS